MFPFVDEALMRVCEAWYVLSHPVRLGKYDYTLRCENCKRTFHGMVGNMSVEVEGNSYGCKLLVAVLYELSLQYKFTNNWGHK
jgi:hypothetical protein